ncbi:MAG: protein-glutamate O-methyltransferase CheR [Alphaproteobacteria bacterium]|nr:protein-glutamate O-methyltransferase CheR [Alphaproteobacteria bacterium]
MITGFDLIASFVGKEAGIVLSQSKGYLVEGRLAPVAEKFGFDSVDALGRRLLTAPGEVKEAVIDAMTTNETFFFRDRTPFNHFEKVIMPDLVAAKSGTRKIRIWCAAASTGQEPYSLAMLLLEDRRAWSGYQIEIMATDISASAVSKAKQGLYTQFEVQRGLPVQLLVNYFEQEGTNWRISPAVRSMVNYSVMNLMAPFRQLRTVDLIFCRNVLIYFDVETKREVLANMADLLAPHGFLVMGAAETMVGVTKDFQRAGEHRGLYAPAQKTVQRMSA